VGEGKGKVEGGMKGGGLGDDSKELLAVRIGEVGPGHGAFRGVGPGQPVTFLPCGDTGIHRASSVITASTCVFMRGGKETGPVEK
jgi:hypothetical protein